MSCWSFPSVSTTALTAFAALLGAALGAFLSHYFSRKRDHLELKRDVLRRVVGYRWVLTEVREDREGHIFTALNETMVVFAGDKAVETEIEKFHSALERGFRADDLWPLAKAMARSARVPCDGWKKELFVRPFSPRPERDLSAQDGTPGVIENRP